MDDPHAERGRLFTGGLVWYAWERVWIWRRLTLGEFAVDFRRSVRKADPAMPILLVICGAAAGVFALIRTGLGIAALACLVTAVTYAGSSQGVA